MNLRQEIVKQYIATLKEDSELDYIFPLLLTRMGFRILSTPKQSKGQSQYGRDVVAVRKEKGNTFLYLIELKGFRARNIDDRVLNEKDGLIESMRASKYTPYKDASIPDLDSYSRKYVYVHNGYVEANTLPSLDGFVSEEFPDGNFERWDLDKLTDLFSRYLFEETILTDSESYRLFKKVLVLLDAEANDYADIVALIERQIGLLESHKKISQRVIKNYFATLRLIGGMVYFYAKEADNLYPAKYCMDTIVLTTWRWILHKRLNEKKSIIALFTPVVKQQLMVYEAYLRKIIGATGFENGFYGFRSTDVEKVFYPLRCYDFLSDLLYYLFAVEYLGCDDKISVNGKLQIKEILEHNGGFKMPLLDTHSIPIQLLFLYFMRRPEDDDVQFVAHYLLESIENMILRHVETGMWPEMTGNRMALAKSLYSMSDEYCSDSSLLLTILFELLAYIGFDEAYQFFRKHVTESGVSLQVAYPIVDEYDIEENLFSHRLYDEMSVQTNIELPETLDEFTESFRKPYNSMKYRTDEAGFYFLRILAHIYYQTDFFPDFLSPIFCRDISPA